MGINHGYIVLLHVHWYTCTPLYQTLSLLHCLPYQSTNTLNTVLHVNIRYTLYRYFMLFHVHVSPLHRYWDSRHYYCMFVNYRYTNTLLHWISLCAQLLHVLTPLLYRLTVYMHWLSIYSYCMDHGLYYYMDILVFPLYWTLFMSHGLWLHE